MKPSIPCVCGRQFDDPAFSYSSRPAGETDFGIPEGAYSRSYDKCLACGHWFQNLPSVSADFYKGAYVSATYGDRLLQTFNRIRSLPEARSDNVLRVKRILSFAEDRFGERSTLRLLDIGSGTGIFPYAMNENNWQVTALDPDSNACSHMRENLGLHVICGDFMGETLAIEDSFDVVSLNKVLEHVEDPASMLARAKDLIREPSGVVYVEVPDADLASGEGPNREEFFLEHLHVFSFTSLVKLIDSSGFQVLRAERLHEPSGKFTIYAFASPRSL